MAELFLNNNKIANISTTSLMLPNLKKLDLSRNLLTFIDRETFRGIKNLEYLNLADNKFTTFTNLMFHHLSNLNEIILDNNNIGASLQRVNLFDRSGYGLTRKIQSISINRINFGNVPPNFFIDAYDLRKLSITHNKITDVFELPCELQYLDMSDNPLSEIAGEDFVNLPSLRDLKLNNLLISEIPEFAFENLHSLKTLELGRNKNLTQFSSIAFGADVLSDAVDFPLEKLSLKGSRLTKLDAELLEPFGHLTELDLQGNPWHCDCDMKWVKRLQIPEHFTDHLRCGSPPDLFNAKIFDLKSKFFTCDNKKRHIGFAIALFTVCTILAMMAVWIFLCIPSRHCNPATFRDLYGTSAAYSVLPTSPN
ncbi:unnamed protein product [Arctia plantaginis]|uniref:LRRCT domain-containing protein n=1 Tax=Arctia plantaginis TaxID=874455 RepID=A0A8S1B9D2_ARCPL|nr:unnamed protein product [Arctia plantaginis]